MSIIVRLELSIELSMIFDPTINKTQSNWVGLHDIFKYNIYGNTFPCEFWKYNFNIINLLNDVVVSINYTNVI